MKTAFFSCVMLCTSLFATEREPWFSPLWEFQGRAGIVYLHSQSVDTPSGSFSFPGNYTSLHLGMQMTPWPDWNGEIELYLTHTQKKTFAYEAFLLTLRHLLFDGSACDPFNVVGGVTVSFPGSSFLRHFSFPYHGNFNVEGHLTIGKEWLVCCTWINRIWATAGIGIANRGSPWLHALLSWEWQPTLCTKIGLFTQGLFGLGPRNLNLFSVQQFDGYAHIRHRNIDIGAFFSREFGVLGSVRVEGWYSPYAHNFIENTWGLSGTILIPFGL